MSPTGTGKILDQAGKAVTDGAKAVVETVGKVAAGVEAARPRRRRRSRTAWVLTAKIVAGQLDKLQDKGQVQGNDSGVYSDSSSSRRPSRPADRTRRRSSSWRQAAAQPTS